MTTVNNGSSTTVDREAPSTMRAAVIDATGSADAFRLAEVPVPSPISAEFLVRIVAAGVNPIDTKTRAGGGVASAIAAYPAILGSDFSGVVVSSPYEMHPLQPGAEVYGMLPVPRVGGSYAEYASVSSLNLARKPARLSHLEAAGAPVASLTAWGAVVETAGVHPGQRVLIHAAAGGVGHLAVQFARLRGAEVIATASERNVEWLRELGADEVIDYRAVRFEDVLDDVDVVIDLIGNVQDNTGTRSLGVLRPGGLIVNVPSGSWPTLMAEAAAAGVRATRYKVDGSGSTLQKITALFDSGEVRVHLDRVFPLEDVAEAHRSVEGGHTRGKVVLQLGAEPASAISGTSVR